MFLSLLLPLFLSSIVLSAPIDPKPILPIIKVALTSKRALPEPVSVSTAKDYLDQLTVAEPSNEPAYERDKFPTWDTIEGKCDTRETVLKRDGTDVETDSNCAATSGTWVSPYDNATWTNKSDVDIDHIVPLKEAWISGAKDWTTDQREALANDLTRPQLLAVTDNVNQQKSDKDIAEWLPPEESYHCTYARAWVTVKQFYKLTIDDAEKSAISDILDKSC